MTPRSASSGTRWTRLTSASRAKLAPWISWRSASRQTSTPLSPTARMVKAASRAVQRALGSMPASSTQRPSWRSITDSPLDPHRQREGPVYAPQEEEGERHQERVIERGRCHPDLQHRQQRERVPGQLGEPEQDQVVEHGGERAGGRGEQQRVGREGALQEAREVGRDDQRQGVDPERAGGDQVEEQAADQRPADARGGAPGQRPTGNDQQDQVREGAGQVEPGRQRHLQDRRRQQDQRRGQILHGAAGRKSVRTMTMEMAEKSTAGARSACSSVAESRRWNWATWPTRIPRGKSPPIPDVSAHSPGATTTPGLGSTSMPNGPPSPITVPSRPDLEV